MKPTDVPLEYSPLFWRDYIFHDCQQKESLWKLEDYSRAFNALSYEEKERWRVRKFVEAHQKVAECRECHSWYFPNYAQVEGIITNMCPRCRRFLNRYGWHMPWEIPSHFPVRRSGKRRGPREPAYRVRRPGWLRKRLREWTLERIGQYDDSREEYELRGEHQCAKSRERKSRTAPFH